MFVEITLTLLKQSTHLAYIIAAANLHAFNYGLKGNPDTSVYKKVADAVIVPEFTPRSGVKVQINENEAPQQDAGGGGDSSDLARSIALLTWWS